MGYVSEKDEAGEHEGWVVMTYADGSRSSGTSNSRGHYPEGYTYGPGAEIVEPPRPFEETIGWLPVCECGWSGIEVPVMETGTDMDRYREPSSDQEHLIMYQWRLHLRDEFPA